MFSCQCYTTYENEACELYIQPNYQELTSTGADRYVTQFYYTNPNFSATARQSCATSLPLEAARFILVSEMSWPIPTRKGIDLHLEM